MKARIQYKSTVIEENCEIDSQGRIKLFLDRGTSNCRNRFQKVISQKKGNFVKWYGEKVELLEILEDDPNS